MYMYICYVYIYISYEEVYQETNVCGETIDKID